jgi:hypothetical protein
MNFRNPQNRVIGVLTHQIPDIPGQLSFYMSEKARRTEKMNLLVSAENDPQQVVETNEMIHMRMSDEHVAHLEEVPCGKPLELTKIKKKSPLLKKKGDE